VTLGVVHTPHLRARVSKDEAASCFETHRSAFDHSRSEHTAGAAMLLSMRPSENLGYSAYPCEMNLVLR
jgi:hypothetical protein